MSEGRGLTLRKKKKDRPKISEPQIPRTPNASAKAPPQRTSQGGLTVSKDPKAPSETSDLVKRRYSTRYNQLPDFSASGTPAVPTLPAGLKRASRGGSPRRADGSYAQPLFVDVDLLGDANMQHDRYVTDILSNASEQDIQEYQNNLLKVKKRTSEELKNSVYQNRTQFIKISKEAEKLKTEMTVLQSLMSDLTTTLSQTNSAAMNGSSPDMNGHSLRRDGGRRSSVANLETLWSTQLQVLWKTVEKSQKFLPAIPGRHIVMETGAWVELDSATWKAKRPVHIVLLNDHLLIASKKRKRVNPDAAQQGPAPTKLVAEECFPLEDVEIEDLKTSIVAGKGHVADERSISAAIMVRAGGKTLTYRVEKRDDNLQKELLMNVRHAMEEQRKANQATTDLTRRNSQQNALNYFAARDPASAKPEIIDSINGTKSSKPDNFFIDVDGKQHSFRWIESQVDDLDIDIAMQRFETAVEKVESLRHIAKGLKTTTTNNTKNVTRELLLAKVDDRASRVATWLVRDLTDKPSFLESVKRNTSFMIRLGFEDRARETYLRARTEQLATRTKQCVFEGDLHAYVFAISFVYFTVVKNTIAIYQASFLQQAALSGVITWATQHLEEFNALLKRQLDSVERQGTVWRDCMDVVWAHERECLGDIGCDFREVIGRGLETRDLEGGNRPMVGGRVVNGGEGREQSRSKSRGRE